jgi:peptidoglycan hydrolase-like protein with peptidoglycan-binding domain
VVVAVVVGVLAVAAGVGWVAGLFDTGGSGGSAGVSSVDSVAVERGDLVQTEGVAGQLGYGDAWGVGSGVRGTVTGLPAEGGTVGRGESLFEVDEDPVTLMFGAVPMYRSLGVGDSGVDVEQLEANLDALGYSGFTVDDEYTEATAEAVRAWQDDRGLAETGAVDPAQIVFAPTALRVAGHLVNVGDQAGQGGVIEVTSTTRVVTVDLDVADRELVTEDAAVTIELPGGEVINGHVAGIGTVAEAPASSGDEQQGGAESDSTEDATIEVTVTIDEGESTGAFDQAPVEVNLESGRAEDVLSVPVAALLAIDDDRYAVEVIEGATRRLVPVELGAFAGGRVAIEGAGITEGTLVGVPGS